MPRESRTQESSNQLRKEISYWETQRNARKCTEFSEMSYWELVSTSNAL